MPTISVDRDEFFSRLGKTYTTRELDDILFEYGLELDEDTTTDPNHPKGEPHQLKIEVPANRYDLLSIEGIVRSLKLYLNPELSAPKFTLTKPEKLQTVLVSPDVARVRPFFASAILRGVTFDKLSYASFIDLQDKLHSNLARKRTLVSMGTHDLSKIAPGDIRYEARVPEDISFVPLNRTVAQDARTMLRTFRETDKHLARYVPIIEDAPVYPVLYSATRQVLSLPPVINSEETKITLDTRDVFIDVTATDETKLAIVVNIIVALFSEYCAAPFTVEPVRIVYEATGREVISPELSPRPFIARASYINSCTGLKQTREQIAQNLERMGHTVEITDTPAYSPVNAQKNLTIDPSDALYVLVPATRPDILHECDIMEDAAVGYGFNKLVKTFPATNTVATPLPVNKLADVARHTCAEAGWLEVLPLILCSHAENFSMLNREDDGKTAVVLANPKTIEYQIVRTSLLPGLLKTVRENRKHALPLRIFEASDVVVKDARVERQARNVRRVAGVYCNTRAGFEIVHGLLDRLMLSLNVPRIAADSDAPTGYYIRAWEHGTYFPNRAAQIVFRPAPTAAAGSGPLDTLSLHLSAVPPLSSGGDVVIGELGILHPTVLKAYELDFPCSVFEFDLEPFL